MQKGILVAGKMASGDVYFCMNGTVNTVYDTKQWRLPTAVWFMPEQARIKHIVPCSKTLRLFMGLEQFKFLMVNNIAGLALSTRYFQGRLLAAIRAFK